MSSNQHAHDIEARLRVLRTIRAAMLGSVILYALVGYVVRPPAFNARALGWGGEGGSVGLSLAAAGIFLAGQLAVLVAAQLTLRSFLRRAEAEQKPELVQTGYIAAFALCDAGALLGLVILLLTGSWIAFGLMGLGALMIAILRPRREQLAAASYKIEAAR